MAYYDMLAGDSYGRYNRKFAQYTSLTTAVYLSEILDVITHVVKKNTCDNNGFFKLNRQYISERTTISLEDQLLCDETLSSLKILERDNFDVDQIRLNLSVLSSILLSDEAPVVNSPKRVVKAANKQQIILASLKKSASTIESDSDLLKAYDAWIESAYEKGMHTKAQIKLFIDKINAYTSDKAVKIKIIDKATSLAYKDADWAINAMNNTKKSIAAPTGTFTKADAKKIDFGDSF